ncbi:PIG-L deacetylase family protein [Granulicoccus phenolivorans]|uniref:PIG-L deacetylase family protein n=1 Tax=Granulicoccus phenolivorans TaxID=266854 RepID=UPI00041608A3|nr:PIG-L deacetylase family protein [Granulicoccus phenolivorans]
MSELPAPPSDVSRLLCVVAHPDDMEYGTSAAVATWTARGVEVAYLLVTAGEAGMAEDPQTVAPIREREQRQACACVGVSELTILGHPDGMIEYGLPLRRDIAREIRRFRPDLVVTANFDQEAYGGLNQADHRAAGLAVADAVRDADNRWVFREQIEQEGLTPWHTRALLVAGHPAPTHALAVGPPAVTAAIASLNSHEAYLRHIGDHPDPAEFIPELLREDGRAAGSEYAVGFRLFDLGGA